MGIAAASSSSIFADVLLDVPANLPGNEYNSARRHADAICIARLSPPIGRIENLN